MASYRDVSQLSESSRADTVKVVHQSFGTGETKVNVVIVGQYRLCAESFRYGSERVAEVWVCQGSRRVKSAVYLLPDLWRQVKKGLSILS